MDKHSGGFYSPFRNNVPVEDMNRAIIEALSHQNYDVISFLIRKKLIPDYSIKGIDGKTILHFIVEHFESIKDSDALLQKIMNNKKIASFIDLQDNHGDTALIIAVKKGNNDVSNLLVRYGANKSIANVDGESVETETIPKTEIVSNKTLLNIFGKMKPILPLTSIDFHNTEYEKNISVPKVDKSEQFDTTSELVQELARTIEKQDPTKPDINVDTKQKELTGGKKQKKDYDGIRPVIDYGAEESIPDRSTHGLSELQRLREKLSTTVHNNTLKKIKDMLIDIVKTKCSGKGKCPIPKFDVDNDEELTQRAKYYKSEIYRRAKEANPTLGNLARAQEMEKMATEENIISVDIEAVTKKFEEKDKARAESSSDEMPKKAKTEKVKKEKKSKVVKMEEGGSSNNSSDYNIDLSDS